MAIEKTQSIVLRKMKLRETSLIVTHFTRDFGKIKTICKGIRKEKSAQFSSFEPFVHLEIVFYKKEKSDLHLLTEAACVNDFRSIRENFTWWSLASYMSELVEELMSAEEPQPAVFQLLLAALNSFGKGSLLSLVRCFEVKLLALSGLWPHLDRCVVCGQSDGEAIQFSPAQGGLVCSRPECLERARDHRPLTKGAVATLRFFEVHDFQDAMRLSCTAKVAKELEQLIRDFILYHVGRELKTSRFLDEVQDVLELV